jgi:hypothetical protein
VLPLPLLLPLLSQQVALQKWSKVSRMAGHSSS